MPHHDFILSFLRYAITLMGSSLCGGLARKIRQPEVIGEITFGIVLTGLSTVIPSLNGMRHDAFFFGLAELGVCILLFKVGLESELEQMLKVGPVSFAVAIIGVIVPFALGGWVVGPWLFPEITDTGHLYIGGILVATSVGITARVLADRKVLNERAAKIIIGAAVIDDVLGLIVLAFLKRKSGAEGGMFDIALHLASTVLLLAGAIVVGRLATPRLNALFSMVNKDRWMRLALPLAACFVSAYLAKLVGLAPIIGSFAAGLVLQEVHFNGFEEHQIGGVEHLIEPLEKAFTPVFFVLTGMSVDITVLLSPGSINAIALLTAVAIVGKVIAGLPAGAKDRWIVGWGMVPRGEVGLIMIAAATAQKALPPEVATVMIGAVILSTVLPLPILDRLLRKRYGLTA